MQALDEEHLGVDAQFGGVDQRKIFALASEQLPKIGYKERAHLMNPMVPGLAGGKMSSSDPDSKIDLLDTPEAVRKKLKKAYAVAKEVDGNGILGFIEYVLLPVSALKRGGKAEFVVEGYGGEKSTTYDTIEKIKDDYKADMLTPQSIKASVATALNALLEPIQADFQGSPEFQEIEKKAYPPLETKKKEKKVKDKGSKYPGGAKAVEAQPDGHVEGPGKDQVNLANGAEEALKHLEVTS